MIFLAACAAFKPPPTHYLYIPFNGSYGYAHTELGGGRLEVTFSAGLTQNPTYLRRYGTIYAAELARKSGVDSLVVDDFRINTIYLREERTETRFPPDTTKKNSERVTRISSRTDFIGRQDITLLVSLCKSNCSNGLQASDILQEALSDGLIPDPAAVQNQ